MGVLTCGDLFRERAACLHVMTPHTSRWLIKVHEILGLSMHPRILGDATQQRLIPHEIIFKTRIGCWAVCPSNDPNFCFSYVHRPSNR